MRIRHIFEVIDNARCTSCNDTFSISIKKSRDPQTVGCPSCGYVMSVEDAHESFTASMDDDLTQ